MNDLDPEDWLRFEQLVLPHVDNAFNLARWLLRSREDAEDVSQEALLRACRFFRGFHGGDARAWLLQIVRNTSYSWLEKNRPRELMVEFDEELHPQSVATLESIAIADEGRECLSRAIETPATPSPRSSCVSTARRPFLPRGLRRLRRFPLVRSCPRSPVTAANCIRRWQTRLARRLS